HQALVGRLASVGLKWPNDVLVTGHSEPDRKLAGILVERIETPQGPAAVIGIGLNVSLTQEERPVPTATSLLIELGEELDRTTLLADLVASLDRASELLTDAEALRAAYTSACVTIGRDVRVELPSGDSLVGRVSGLDESGRLGVDTPEGTTWVGAGDVIHVR
ncbi:MAG TPA: biotin--[acetyl-CoA-carboxylase] ligase, partial [Nocardioides sp.]